MSVSGESFYGLDTAFIRSFPALKYPRDLKLRLESDPNWFGKMFGSRLSHTAGGTLTDTIRFCSDI